jgi:hypothetical protein
MNSEISKFLHDYHEMIATYIKIYDEYTATKCVPKHSISHNTIQYLNNHGFTCKLVTHGGYEPVWYISKDSYLDGGAFAEFRTNKSLCIK